MLRATLAMLGGIGLAWLAFVEIGLAYPVSGWLYPVVIIVLAVGLIRRVPVQAQRSRLAVLSIAIIALAALYDVEWTTRKPFLRDLAKVRPGMTEPEVRQIMRRYQEGTGWPESPMCTEAQRSTGQTVDGPESRSSAQPLDGSGELTLPNSLVFRHSNAAKFNSDWGIISFSGGRVVGVSFSSD
ncbi:MAG: hypothetical protein JNK85_00905 [Verrucomicrobiales bacterium]|nr:hypothetical protein [Verrucomicrobiales bacterium]